jgi:hypothetical protein
VISQKAHLDFEYAQRCSQERFRKGKKLMAVNVFPDDKVPHDWPWLQKKVLSCREFFVKGTEAPHLPHLSCRAQSKNLNEL